MKPKAKKKQVKKVVKKTTKKRKPAQKSEVADNAIRALVTVTPEQLYQPELETGKYSLIPSPLKTNQVATMLEKTPTQFIKQRKGRGGKTFDYVTGHYMHAKLDYVTGRMYDFEILKQEVLGDFVVTLGKLTLKDPRTKQALITRMQNGTKAIAFLTEEKVVNGKKTRVAKAHTPENYVDIGNDFKASATDAFKKCCADLGIARDVYAANENFEENFETPAPPSNIPTTPEGLQKMVTLAVQKTNDVGQLMDIDEKLQASDKFPKNFKEAIHKAISNKVDQLTNQQ